MLFSENMLLHASIPTNRAILNSDIRRLLHSLNAPVTFFNIYKPSPDSSNLLRFSYGILRTTNYVLSSLLFAKALLDIYRPTLSFAIEISKAFTTSIDKAPDFDFTNSLALFQKVSFLDASRNSCPCHVKLNG